MRDLLELGLSLFVGLSCLCIVLLAIRGFVCGGFVSGMWFSVAALVTLAALISMNRRDGI